MLTALTRCSICDIGAIPEVFQERRQNFRRERRASADRRVAWRSISAPANDLGSYRRDALPQVGACGVVWP